MKTAKDKRSVSIKGSDIKSYLKAAGSLTQAQFAHLLGVNPASLSRWGSQSKDSPTSTTFLVMVPLLLSVGVELMPEYYEEVVRHEFEAAFGAAETKKNTAKLRKMAKERFLTVNPDLQRARALFDELKKAWDKIDRRG